MAAPCPATLQVRSHPTKGRALHAARALRPGQTVAVFAEPALALAAATHLSRVCGHCLRPGQPRACSRCRAVYYCGPACQAAGWAAVHARECKALRARSFAGKPAAALPSPIRALVLALLHAPTGRALAALEGHVARRRRRAADAQSNGSWADLQIMAMAGCSFAGLEETEANVARAVELLCKIQTNAFYSYDADVGQVAIFLEPTLAMANHSCVPNALVQFVGRKAVLRAERPIAEGDEIEISYTDYTAPLSKRQDALASYCFKCQCPRCSDDLNVYQVAAAKLVEAAPSGLGLVADLSSRLRRHPAVVDSDKQTLARTVGDSATMLMGEQPMADPRDTPEQRRGVLSAQYRDCASLVDAGLWAVTPVPEMVTEISIYYAEQGDFAPALALACLVATECDPYRYLAFFHPARAKTLLMIAKLLANTAEGTAKLVDTVVAVSKQVTVGQKVQDALQDIDQVSLCQMLLLMILRLSPDGLAAEWETATAAREMLRDIEQLPGREKEVSLIRAWTTDPAEGQSQAFFDYAVVQQVSALASLGRAILQVDFGSNARA